MASLLDPTLDDYGRPPGGADGAGGGLLSLLSGGPTPDSPVGGYLDFLQRQIGDENLRQQGLDPDVVRLHQQLLAEHPELRLPQTPAAPGPGTSDPYVPTMDPQAQIDAANTRAAGDLGLQLGGTFEGGLKVPTRAGNIARVDMRTSGTNALVDPKPMTGRAVGTVLDQHIAAGNTPELYGGRGDANDFTVTLPPGVTRPGDITDAVQGMVDRTAQVASAPRDPGVTPPRYWYQAGAQAMHSATGEDLPATERLAASAALTSPQTDVAGNTNAFVNAWNQATLGDPIQVKTGSQNTALEDALYGSTLPESRKVGPFFWNHMRQLDPTIADNITNDIWQMRDSGFTNPGGAPYSGTPSVGEDNYVRMQVANTTRQLNAAGVDGGGWTPEQVQASLWVHAKASQQGTDLGAAGFHFGNGLDRLTAGQASAHQGGPALLGPNASDPQAQSDFADAARPIMTDALGRDAVNSSLGMLTPPDQPGAAAVSVTGDGIKPSSRTLMDAGTLVRATLLRQPSALWTAHPDVAGLPTYANANVVHAFSGSPDDYLPALQAALDNAGGGLERAHLQTSPAGVRILNINQRTGLTNPDFQAAVKAAISDAGLPADLQRARADYGYFTHDWTADPTGSGYIGQLAQLPPHIQRVGDQLLAGLGGSLDQAGSQISGRTAGAGGVSGGTGPWTVPGFAQAVGPQQSLAPVRPWVRRPSPTDPGSNLFSLLRGGSP